MKLKELLNVISTCQIIQAKFFQGEYIDLTWGNISNYENCKVVNVEAYEDKLLIVIKEE